MCRNPRVRLTSTAPAGEDVLVHNFTSIQQCTCARPGHGDPFVDGDGGAREREREDALGAPESGGRWRSGRRGAAPGARGAAGAPRRPQGPPAGGAARRPLPAAGPARRLHALQVPRRQDEGRIRLQGDHFRF